MLCRFATASFGELAAGFDKVWMGLLAHLCPGRRFMGQSNMRDCRFLKGLSGDYWWYTCVTERQLSV